MAPLDSQNIRNELEQARRQLLDLSLCNRLLNYRPSRMRGIEITGEDPATVFDLLVREQKAMSFVGVPAPRSAKFDLFKAGSELSESPKVTDLPAIELLEAPPVDQGDLKLSTRLLERNLQDRLLRIWTDARTAVEEQ